MRLIVSANPDVFGRMRGDPDMCEALMELMRDEFEEAVEKRATRAEREAAERAELAERAAEREVANRSAEAVRVLMDRFGLGRDEAMDAF